MDVHDALLSQMMKCSESTMIIHGEFANLPRVPPLR